MAVAIVGATAGALVKKVVSAYLRDKSSQSVVVKRIEKKMGVKFFDEPLKESNLEDIRKIIQQELAAFSNAKPAEVDEKIMESFLVLISGQEKLLEKVDGIHGILEELKELDKLGKLDKLDNLDKLEFLNKLDDPKVLSTLERMATVLGFYTSQNYDKPEEIVSGLVRNTLKGRPEAVNTYREFVEEGYIPGAVDQTVKEYEYLAQVREEEKQRFREILSKFERTGKVDHEIEVYLQVAELFEIDEFEIDMNYFLDQLLNDEVMRNQFGLLSLTNILDRTGRLKKLSKYQHNRWIDLLKIEFKDATDDIKKLEIIYFLRKLGYKVPTKLVRKTFEKVRESGFSEKELKERVPLTKRLMRFFKREGIRSKYEVNASIRNLRRLISKLEVRKFKRTTQLLLRQLDAIHHEINLLIVDFEKAREAGKSVEFLDLEDLLVSLNEIIQRPEIRDLRSDSRLRLYQLLDSSLYLQDQVSIHNSITLLETGGMKINSVFSSKLKNYRRTEYEELKTLLAKIQITETFKQEDVLAKITEELPSPSKESPTRQKKKHLKAPQKE
ncbi:MAG: hypothetical protein ACFFD4_18645 [Candidatus Odinarchaeota archaeon]